MPLACYPPAAKPGQAPVKPLAARCLCRHRPGRAGAGSLCMSGQVWPVPGSAYRPARCIMITPAARRARSACGRQAGRRHSASRKGPIEVLPGYVPQDADTACRLAVRQRYLEGISAGRAGELAAARARPATAGASDPSGRGRLSARRCRAGPAVPARPGGPYR
jgi:hypothetical protein